MVLLKPLDSSAACSQRRSTTYIPAGVGAGFRLAAPGILGGLFPTRLYHLDRLFPTPLYRVHPCGRASMQACP